MSTKVITDWLKGQVKWFLPFCLLAFLPLLVACSETDENDIEEFPDWKNRNEQYFQQLYNSAQGSSTLQTYRCYSKSSTATLAAADHIVVEVLETGSGTTSPYVTDSVAMHYRGWLIPSTSYPKGLQFDSSYSGNFDPDVAVASKGVVGNFVDGFTTALLYMHRGDHWRVTIPYQLAYGSQTKGDVQPYSTLIFEVYLDDFWTSSPAIRR